MADFEPFFELKNQYRESCPVLLQSGALYREEPTAPAEAEETEAAETTPVAEQEEATSPRTFLRLAFRNIDPRAVTSVYVDIHMSAKPFAYIKSGREDETSSGRFGRGRPY